MSITAVHRAVLAVCIVPVQPHRIQQVCAVLMRSSLVCFAVARRSTGQDQVQALKKELSLIVPSMSIFLDCEDLDDIGGLEGLIERADMTLVFLSEGYYSSWNALREMRHALLVNSAGEWGNSSAGTLAAVEAYERRRGLGVKTSTNIILMREPAKIHGAMSIESIVNTCPEKIGCEQHVLHFDDNCQHCAEFPLNVREFIHERTRIALGDDHGVITWQRVKAYKMVSLKQVVQQMLVGTRITKSGQACEVRLNDELLHKRCVLPVPSRNRTARILLHMSKHGDCPISMELQRALPALLPGVSVTELRQGRIDRSAVPGSTVHARSHTGAGPNDDFMESTMEAAFFRHKDPDFASSLVVPVYKDCFADEQAVRRILLALKAAIPVVLVHEQDPQHRGCEFGVIFDACPVQLKAVRGCKGMKLFDPIAVAWVRGPHQDVSTKLLARALGATFVSADHEQWDIMRRSRSCGSALSRQLKTKHKLTTDPARAIRGWSVFDKWSSSTSSSNPMHQDQSGAKKGEDQSSGAQTQTGAKAGEKHTQRGRSVFDNAGGRAADGEMKIEVSVNPVAVQQGSLAAENQNQNQDEHKQADPLPPLHAHEDANPTRTSFSWTRVGGETKGARGWSVFSNSRDAQMPSGSNPINRAQPDAKSEHQVQTQTGAALEKLKTARRKQNLRKSVLGIPQKGSGNVKVNKFPSTLGRQGSMRGNSGIAFAIDRPSSRTGGGPITDFKATEQRNERGWSVFDNADDNTTADGNIESSNPMAVQQETSASAAKAATGGGTQPEHDGNSNTGAETVAAAAVDHAAEKADSRERQHTITRTRTTTKAEV